MRAKVWENARKMAYNERKFEENVGHGGQAEEVTAKAWEKAGTQRRKQQEKWQAEEMRATVGKNAGKWRTTRENIENMQDIAWQTEEVRTKA